MDMEFGPDGSLYVLDYGSGFFGGAPDSALYRLDYVGGVRSPIAVVTADVTSTPESALTVQFSSEGSFDPDGTGITYAWNFGDGSPTSTEANPTHTYTGVGTYTARLTVTDETGRTGSADVRIVVGNGEPQITIEAPPAGGFFDFGDQVAYDITVTDPEDGTISGSDEACARVRVDYALGHDDHSHPLTQANACEGLIQTPRDAGHPTDAKLYGVIGVSYTDRGGQPGTEPVTATESLRLWPKLLQAEHYTDMRGIQTVADGGAGGGQRVGYTDNAGGSEAVNYIAWDPVNLQGIDSLTITASSGGGGGPIEVRLDDPATGPLLGTVQVPNTGDWTVHRPFELDIDAPAGTHKLFLAFPNGGLDVDQIRFNGRGVSANARPTVSASADVTEGGVPLAVSFTGTASDPEGEALTYAWDFGDGSAGATTANATHTYTEPGTYTARLTVTDAGGLTASDTVTIRATNCPAGQPDPNDEFDGSELDTCRWSEIVRDDPTGRSVSGGALAIDTGNGTDMYGGNTNAENLVLQPAPEGGWVATTKVDITLAEKDYEQAALMVYGDDDNFAKLSFIKVPGGRNLEFILQDEGQPQDAGAADRTPNFDTNFGNTIYLRITSDGQFLTASWSANGTDWTTFGRPRPLSAIPDPKIGLAAFNGDGDGDAARFDFFHLEEGDTGEPTCTEPAQPDPGYRMIFDNTAESAERWRMAGPGGFSFTQDCTLESFGGLGLLWYPEEFDRPYTVKMEWMMPGDENSGVFVGFDDPGTDPWSAVNGGHEIQIDATDDPDSTTGAIYNAQAADAEARDAVLNPPGEWNTYAITLEDRRIVVRLNGQVINDYTAQSDAEAAQRFAHGYIGLQNHGTGDEVHFRNIQVKEHGPTFELPACEGQATSGSDDFEGDAFDTCRWSETKRYDAATIEQSGGALHVETSAGDIYGANDTEPTNVVLQEAPEGDWVMETQVRVPLVKCCQQAGLIVHGSDDDYVKFDVIADDGRPGETRIELRSETGDVVAQPEVSEWVATPENDTYWLRLTKTGNTYTGAYRVEGGEWVEFGTPVTNSAVADAPVGVFALGVFQDAPIYASFESFSITGDDPEEPGAPTVQAFADPAEGAAPLRVRFSATGLDPEGGRLTYAWDFGDGGRSFSRVARHTYTEPGTYTATVTATDQEGKTGTAEVEVTVTDGAAPTVTATAERQSGWRYRFTAQGDDPDGAEGRMTYEWDFGDGGTAFGRVARHAYTEPGTYTAVVTATDEDGMTATDEVQVTIANAAPTVQAAADPRSGSAPLRVRFTSQGTDPDGHRLTYAWDFGDDSEGASTRNARHTYTTAGTHVATVTVTDEHGASATADVEVTVAGNRAPTVRAAANPVSGTAPLRVTFTSAASDPDGDRVSTVWDFGDGQKAGGPRAVHTYTRAGTYTASVTVTDARGGSGRAQVQVTVAAPGAQAAPQTKQDAPPASLPPVGGGEGDVAGEAAGSQVRMARSQKVRRVVRRGLRYRITCATDCRVSSQLRLSGRLARRLGLETQARALGRARARTVRAGATRTVVVRLDRSLRRQLLRAMRAAGVERLKATVVTTVRSADGTDVLRNRIVLER
jgi:PKD repeat protein